jgi:putative ABC transport system substrate-binding protein
MRRREFFVLVSSAAVALPMAARAQRSDKPVIGFLRSSAASGSTHLVAALRRGLNEAGMVEGENVDIVYRYADGELDRLKDLAAELIRGNVTVIIANTAAARVAKAATASVPIIFVTGTDPVRTGLVNSFNRPGGNVTGIYFTVSDLTDKRLGLLKEMMPNSSMVALLTDPNGPAHETEVKEVERASRIIGQEFILVKCATADGFAAAFETIATSRANALLVGAGPFFLGQRQRIVSLAAQHRIPAFFATRQYAEAGGLISYGPNQTDAYRQAGVYAGHIIKGEKPSDMPVMQSHKFELVINTKTAKALGLALPDKLIALADEVIE